MFVDQTGRTTIVSGTSPHGQGHETPLSQIVADQLGIHIDQIKVTYGDTSLLPWGTFTAGSRSGALGGGAVYLCAQKIKEKMTKLAAKLFGDAEENIEFNNGYVYSKGKTNSISFGDLAQTAYKPRLLPIGMEPGLFAFTCFAPPMNTFPFGSHIAIVEIDRETGKTTILDYVSVDDCGKVLNPLIVDGQIHGGIAQGLGQALMEVVTYSQDGQLLTGSFLDYHIPLAEDIPNFRCFRTETPTFANPMGIKGVGEAGTIAATPALVNAIADALLPVGARVRDMPLGPCEIKSFIG
jgi:carbon-monoxide dehydrogenase large subunit